MKHSFWLILSLILLINVFESCDKNTAAPIYPDKNVKAEVIKTVYYQDISNFSNPERGIFSQQISYSNSPSLFTQSFLDKLKSSNITLVRKSYTFNDFKSGPISDSYLQHIQDDLNFLRNNGFKIILRFAYTYNEPRPHTDAPLNIVLSHIEQLKPILQNNSDVIALMEAGLIGEWGEWHDSSNGLDNAGDMKTILFKLLDALPKSRTIAVRYQDAKKKIFETNAPISDSQAFDLSNRSRTGHHNDCFLASADDWGTYWPIDAASLKTQKDYLNEENKYLPQVGETCNCNSPHSDCSNAVKELAQMRWSALNKDYIDCVLKSWISGGCYEDIARKLGYRFRLISSEIPNIAKVDSMLLFNFTVKNDGFASPYNTRNLELVLRSKTSGVVERFKLNFDARTWLPDDGEIKISTNIQVPSSMAPGDYELLLNLPDPANSLNKNPAYSIRLANENTWEPATGYNSLQTTVTIKK